MREQTTKDHIRSRKKNTEFLRNLNVVRILISKNSFIKLCVPMGTGCSIILGHLLKDRQSIHQARILEYQVNDLYYSMVSIKQRTVCGPVFSLLYMLSNVLKFDVNIQPRGSMFSQYLDDKVTEKYNSMIFFAPSSPSCYFFKYLYFNRILGPYI